jgi:hypothetical protein
MAGKASKGTILERATVAVGHITTIGGPSMTAQTIDMTTHDSTWAEYASGMKDAGEVTFDCNWMGTASQISVRGDLGAAAPVAYTITFPDGHSVDFNAVVTAFGMNAGGVNDKLSNSVTLKISGEPTWTAPA